MKLHYSNVSDSILKIKVDKRTDVYNFGADNAQPSLIEALISMSATAKTCVDKASKAVYGKSFGKIGDIKVNNDETLNELLRLTSREYVKQNNLALIIGYDANLDIKSIKMSPITSTRKGKSDNLGFSGKYVVYDNWDKSKSKQVKSSDYRTYYAYTDNKESIKAQIWDAAEVKKDTPIEDCITKYNGQILFLKKDKSYIYSLSDLTPVLGYMYLEHNSQTFTTNGAAKGFLNTKLLTTQPFPDEKVREEFKEDLNNLRGAENSSDVLLLESSSPSDDLSSQIKLDDLSGNYNDKLFEYSDSKAEKSICKAMTVPQILIIQNDNSMFGNSGELLKQAKLELWENREEDRNQLEEMFSSLMSKFQGSKKITEKLKIISPYVDENIKDETPKDINAEAQATLRGSVGGVTSLLSIQQSVQNGTTSRDSGIAMIVNIFGFTKEIAEEILGSIETK